MNVRLPRLLSWPCSASLERSAPTGGGVRPVGPVDRVGDRYVGSDGYLPESSRPERYGGPSGAEPIGGHGPGELMRQGARGVGVSTLQQKLKDAGFDPGSVDGIFGPRTGAAVRAYQQARGLEVDGVVGPQTWGALGVSGQAPASVAGPGVVDTADGPMVRRSGHLISARVAARYDQMVAAAASEGVTLAITSGYRSYDEQVVLWNKYGRDPARVARPGHSNHQSGTAIDFTNTAGAWAWLKRNASRFGFHNYPPEPWHYSLNGR